MMRIGVGGRNGARAGGPGLCTGLGRAKDGQDRLSSARSAARPPRSATTCAMPSSLALDHHGRKLGGLPVEVIYEDDTQKPDVGVQKTQKLIESDHVDFIVGYIWSNVLLASLKPLVNSKTMTVITNAGPSQVAGELCSPYVFSTSWQERSDPRSDGHVHEPEGREDGLPDRSELCRRQGHAAGMRRSPTRARSSAQEMTRWPDQLDFSAELSKARAAQAGRDLRVLSGRRRRAVHHPICAGGPEGPNSALSGVHASTSCRCRG